MAGSSSVFQKRRGFSVFVDNADQKTSTSVTKSVGDGGRRANKKDCLSHFPSLRDSRSFKDVLLNVAPKVKKSSLHDEKGLNTASFGLESRNSEVVSVHPKPTVAVDPKWRISIKKEEMN
ncbi:hypothetical protein V6N13_113635 [Hibiscus sabdariffa]